MSIATASTSAKTAEPTPATINTNAAKNTTFSKQYLKLAGLILGLSTILLLMLLSFVTPLLNSGAKDLPLAVGGPDMVTTKITQGLEAKSPDAFAVTNYSTAEEATEAVRNREAIGAITAGPNGITIVTASAAGTPYSTILKQIGEGLSQTGQPIHYTDVAPLTAKDPSGSAISMLALPMIFGGMSSAVAFSTVFKKSRRKQIMGAIGVAILGGLIASATLYFGFGAFEANFWPTTSVIMLGIAAISLTVLGLNSLLGFAGIGLGAVLMLFVANPLSGLATDRFCFEGFPPRRSGERGRVLRSLAREERTLIFFESPRRVHDTLTDMVGAFGAGRRAATRSGLACCCGWTGC